MRIDPNGIIRTDGECFPDNGITLCSSNRQCRDASSLLFFQLNGADQRVPFVIWVYDVLNTVRVKSRIAVGKSDAARRIGCLTDANKYFHVAKVGIAQPNEEASLRLSTDSRVWRINSYPKVFFRTQIDL